MSFQGTPFGVTYFPPPPLETERKIHGRFCANQRVSWGLRPFTWPGPGCQGGAQDTTSARSAVFKFCRAVASSQLRSRELKADYWSPNCEGEADLALCSVLFFGGGVTGCCQQKAGEEGAGGACALFRGWGSGIRVSMHFLRFESPNCWFTKKNSLPALLSSATQARIEMSLDLLPC